MLVLNEFGGFLGHIISSEGFDVNQRKTEAVENWPRPLTPTDVRSLLGLAGYLDNLGMVLRPLLLP